jgi:hypothetical protein
MDESMERRKSFRMPFTAEVFCRTEGQNYHGIVKNLSSAGFFMKAADYPPVDMRCEVEIVIRGNHSKLRIDELKGQVIRHNESGVGVKFIDRLEWVALIPIYYHKMQESELS